MTSPGPALPDTGRLGLLGAASVAIALAAADTYVVVLALTDMMAGVGIGIDALQRATPIVSGFLLGYVAVLPLVGRLSDLLDRRRVLLGCLVVFVVGSAVTALAVDLPVLVAGRVLQGLGGGGLVPATLALVADLWPPGRRGTPLGVVGAVQELGSVVGPVVGAGILAVSGWRTIFWANAVAGVVLYAVIRGLGARAGKRGGVRRPGGIRAALVTARVLAVAGLALGGLALAAPPRLVTDVVLGAPFVPISGDSRVLTPLGVVAAALLVAAATMAAPRWWPVLRRADVVGATLVTGALGCLVVSFASADPERELVGALGRVLLPVAGVCAGLYWWWHRHADRPLVPRGVVGGRGARAVLVSLLVGVALVAVVVDVPLLARLAGSHDETGAALVLVRFLVAVPVGAVAGGVALRRLGAGAVAGPGLLLAAAGLVVMSGWSLRSVQEPLPTTVVLAAVGLGMGLALAPVNDAVLADSPADAHGVASSLVVAARMVGMVVGLALLTAVGLRRYFDAARALPDPLDTNALLATGVVQIQTVFLGGAVAAALGAAVAATLGIGLRRQRPDRAPRPTALTAAEAPASRPGRRP
mgnify:CR=1 FL=1